jgi:D-3-phosphoglycerate dehydrogenase
MSPKRGWAASNGATLGILGYGTIGERLAQLGLALGMTVLVADPTKGHGQCSNRSSLRTCWQDPDFVVCLAIANEQTENLMNAEAFAQMMPSAYYKFVARQPGRRGRACPRARRKAHLGRCP